MFARVLAVVPVGGSSVVSVAGVAFPGRVRFGSGLLSGVGAGWAEAREQQAAEEQAAERRAGEASSQVLRAPVIIHARGLRCG
jgi:hypothetical protein